MQVWDYDIPENWQPATDQEWEWYLVRKINYDNFTGLKKDIIKKYFPAIKKQLDPGKRAMFEYFFSHDSEFIHYNHDKKTLKKRELLNDIMIDSLDDIAANKTMAYFDRKEPKDLFDIYFLIINKNFTPAILLNLTQKKFGLTFSESLFWSESFKFSPLLNTLKPFIENQKDNPDDILKKIEEYFKKGSAEYLKKELS